MTGEYLWIWVAAGTSMALYLPLALKLGGYINAGQRWWQFKLVKSTRNEELPVKDSEGAFKMVL